MLFKGSLTAMTFDDPTDDAPAITAPKGNNPKVSPNGKLITYGDLTPSDLYKVMAIPVTGGAPIEVYNFLTSGPGRYRVMHRAFTDDDTIYAAMIGGGPNAMSLWKFSVSAKTAQEVHVFPEFWSLLSLEANHDGTRLSARRTIDNNLGETLTRDVISFDLTGNDVKVVQGTVTDESAITTVDWRPDGNGHVVRREFAAAGGGAHTVYDKNGNVIDSYTGTTTMDRASTTRFTPDGGHTYRNGCLNGTCGIVVRRIPDSLADVAPDEPMEVLLPGSEGMTNFTEWQPQRQPVIFIHGFAGSRLGCSRDTWLPDPLFVGGDLLEMRLGADGESPYPGTCGVTDRGLLETAFGTDIYGDTREWIEGLAGEHGHMYVWDWRKDPRDAIDGLTTRIDSALAADDMVAANVRKVAIIAHSMGGQVTRAFIDVDARAKRVARAVTVGTPYWGAPKAVFPVNWGVELPTFTELDMIMPNKDFAAFARTMTGLFFLFPSVHFGNWLTVKGLSESPLTPSQLRDRLKSLGVNLAAYDRAVEGHAAAIDGFERHGVDFRVLLGMGMPTIKAVRVDPGAGEKGADKVEFRYDNGDGTVPSVSASQGPMLTRDPLGEDVSLMNVCGVGHMKLTTDPVVQSALSAFLTRGAPPRKTQKNCTAEGAQWEVTNLKPPPAPTTRAAGPAMSFADAVNAGAAQMIELPESTVVVTGDLQPVDLVGEGDGSHVAATRIGADGTLGQTLYYGPITGKLELVSGGAEPQVLDDGTPLTGTTERPAGFGNDEQEPVDPGGPADPGNPADPGTPAGPVTSSAPAGPPAPAVPAVGALRPSRLELRLPRGALRVRRGRVKVPLACVGGTAPCVGRLTILPAGRGAALGGVAVTLGAGGGGTVRVKVSRRGLRRLGGKRQVTVRYRLVPGTGLAAVTRRARLRTR